MEKWAWGASFHGPDLDDVDWLGPTYREGGGEGAGLAISELLQHDAHVCDGAGVAVYILRP